jgi:dipeptidyl aminopeptidase/acylaminoacyl peptidase
VPTILFLALSALVTLWQQPPQEILDVLHAEDLPWVWTAPSGAHLLLADGVIYPPLAERAAPMHELAGVRVDPATNGFHGEWGATNPRLFAVEDGAELALPLPEDARLLDVYWSVDGQRLAMTVALPDHIGLWVGDISGAFAEVEGVALNPLLGDPVDWLPDQRRLLVKRVPSDRGEAPPPPAIPAGPKVLDGDGEAARSTYEARNLLQTAHDEALFVHHATSQITRVDPANGKLTDLGAPGMYAGASASPDGKWLLVERLAPPWSHETGWWRFAHSVELWNKRGKLTTTLAELPLSDQVPVHGVTLGPRRVSWRATAPATLIWVEALDGGDPAAEADHRDRLVTLDAPFSDEPVELFRAQHRVRAWRWGAEGGTLMVSQRERMRRWRHEWLLDVDAGTARPWFDLSENERYANPGGPLMRPLDNGRWVLRQQGDRVFFRGSGGSAEGDRPFVDLKSMTTGETERLFRSEPGYYERFVAFAGGEDRFLIRRESATEVPNYHRVTLGATVDAAQGEASRTRSMQPVTKFEDPAPQLREITRQIVTYERADGTPLSFHLYLPPGHQEGTPLPTVLYAYPLEYNDPAMAGQVRGSEHRFTRFWGPSHLYFLLQGYAVLDSTAMPVVGDPETAYDSFVEQLVADAEAAVAKAVELGVTDPDRVGIAGHSHGGLMTATLLAHSDLFRAGIARSGGYNQTIRPFGFQSERRTMYEARDTYLQCSPIFVADQIDEPLLLIHGAIDENPGTIPYQSDRLFEAVRGTGGTTRLVMLPHEGHGYRARESVEHVLWEQLQWFDRYVKNGSPRPGAGGGQPAP